jgi:hypothetical protein
MAINEMKKIRYLDKDMIPSIKLSATKRDKIEIKI